MFNACVRACLLVLGAALAASAGSGQPPDAKKEEPKTKGPRPYYTAFPDLKPVGVISDDIPVPPLPVLAADAPPLRRVRFEQVQAGLAYIAHVTEVMRIGSWSPQFFRDYLDMATEVYRVAAELEDEPAKRVPWYEARVRILKEFEQFNERRVTSGTDRPHIFLAARFTRLQAEAELLKLKTEVERGGTAVPTSAPPLLPAQPSVSARQFGRVLPRLFHRR